MIVWGGGQQLGLLASGAAYDPAADTWRTITNTAAPAARTGHTAVWTGTEMLVWGGAGVLGPLGDGAAYNPALDTWRPLSNAAAPQARVLHSATWTGTAMLVWGGQGVFPPPAPNSVDLVFGDGASYDPTGDAWTAMGAGGPAARGHTSVWTGTRLMTWGGRDAFALTISPLNVGGVYDPVLAQWAATPVGTAPAARVGHTAVWTGPTGMLVWGGAPGIAAPVATGGRLVPGAATWQATSTAGAPAARTGHTAIWTGAEMVIWGGLGNLGLLLADGAAYAPGTNGWRPLAPGFLPAARTGHTAVWTGATMIVWGGNSTPADTYLATGAVVIP